MPVLAGRRALLDAADEFEYHVTDTAVEAWHMHWLVEHGYDAVPKMVGRLKTRMRQALDCGRIWTHGYCHRCHYMLREIEASRKYIARHAGCRMLDRRILRP